MASIRTGLTPSMTNRLLVFALDHDFARLCSEYEWQSDEWRSGFCDIVELELRLGSAAGSNLVRRDDIVAVAKWGKHRNVNSIDCPASLSLPFYDAADGAQSVLARDPGALATQLRQATNGLGPTTLSKILRFAAPLEFGALDSRLVRVVGLGDEASKREYWLSLRVRNYGYGWYIPLPQRAWPEDYSKWVDILRFFALLLNNSGVACPHPDGFVTGGLRTAGTWACADVEMALFAWASSRVKQADAPCSAN